MNWVQDYRYIHKEGIWFFLELKFAPLLIPAAGISYMSLLFTGIGSLLELYIQPLTALAPCWNPKEIRKTAFARWFTVEM